MNKPLAFKRSILWTSIFCFLFISSSLCTKALAQGQGTLTTFGKNRVQFKDFQWFYYRSFHFDTYYYRAGKELAMTVGKMAEQNLKEIQNVLDYKLESRIQILAFNKLTDSKQTNLGLEEENNNTGGLTQISGNKVFIYFNGDHEDLRKQVRAAIAQVLVNELLYGGNLQEKFQNSALLTLPEWYIPGLVSYISQNWSIELDNQLKDGINSGRYKKFNRLYNKEAIVAGHSIWKFIVDNYGAASISNMLYMTRINRNSESGFIYIIGINYKELTEQWYNYYVKIYDKNDDQKVFPDEDQRFLHKGKKRAASLVYDQVKISPNGKYIAYITSAEGLHKVWIYDIQANKTRKLKTIGYRSLGKIYEPGKTGNEVLLSWHPSSRLLAISYEKKSEAFIYVDNIDSKEDVLIPMYKYEQILGLDYSTDGKLLALSAIQGGQSDIFVFNTVSRMDEQITDDYYDDLYPRFLNNSTKIIFSSNRPEDTLRKKSYVSSPPINNKDLFVFNYITRDKVLTRVTNTPFDNEIAPAQVDSNIISYLSDQSGIINRNLAYVEQVLDYKIDTNWGFSDTTISIYKDTFLLAPASNYARSILYNDLNAKNNQYTEIILDDGKYKVFTGKLDQVKETAVLPESPFKLKTNKAYQQIIDLKLQKELADSIARSDTGKKVANVDSSLKKDNYFFQNEFPSTKKKNNKVRNKDKEKLTDPLSADSKSPKQPDSTKAVLVSPDLESLFGSSKARPYLPSFSTDYIVTQLDNNLLNNTYEPFTGTGPIYTTSRVNLLIKVGTADILEDYRFTGGFRLAGDLTIPEYFFSFENLKKRLDKQFIFYKQGQVKITDQAAFRTNNYEAKVILKYPFTEIAGLRLHTFYRRDETIFLTVSPQSINTPNEKTNNIGMRLEYVYDNTIGKGLNLYNGTRYKFYIERYQTLGKKNSGISNFGFDIRHYEKISRQIIAAIRLASATSFASRKVIYYLGGVDGWLFPAFNNQIQIATDQNYVYQALATNLRGFSQNIRNGNTFTVLNGELRVPLFAYLLNRPIKSDFIKNFQLVGFGDIGASWLGSNPFSERNSVNEINTETGPISIKILEPKTPLVGGYGFGLRSRFLGYFIRFDYAWGILNGQIQKPQAYLTLSLDF